MPKGYRHLTCDERCQIHALKKSGLSVPAIAAQLGRDRSTIHREIRRSSGGRGYRHAQAVGKVTATGEVRGKRSTGIRHFLMGGKPGSGSSERCSRAGRWRIPCTGFST